MRRNQATWVMLGLLTTSSLAWAAKPTAQSGQEQRDGGARLLETKYDYDSVGRLVAMHRPDGTAIQSEFHANGRLAALVSPDGRIGFKYDKNGNCIEVRNAEGRTEYYHDEFNRLNKVTYAYPTLNKSVAYEYDAWGKPARTTVLSPSNQPEFTVSYEHDLQGRPVQVTAGGLDIRYAYDTATGRQITRTLSTGQQSIYTYQTSGQLQRVEHFQGSTKVIGCEYNYNPAGQLTQRTITADNKVLQTEYQYTPQGRLTQIEGSDGNKFDYQYDGAGQLMGIKSQAGTLPVQLDGLGRFKQIGNTQIGTDSLGRFASWQSPDVQGKLSYDAFDRLKELSTPDLSAKYSYSADGFLIGASTGKQQHSFVPDPMTGRSLLTSSPNAWSTALAPDLSMQFRQSQLEIQFGDGLGNPSAKVMTEINKPVIEPFKTAMTPDVGSWKTEILPSAFQVSAFKPMAMDHSTFQPMRDLHFETMERAAHGDRFPRNVMRNLELGQSMPMPSAASIRAHDQYWSSGQYWQSDPYYRANGLVPGPVPGTLEEFDARLQKFGGEVRQVGIPVLGIAAFDIFVRPALIILDWASKPLWGSVLHGAAKGAVKVGRKQLVDALRVIPDAEGLVKIFQEDTAYRRVERLSSCAAFLRNVVRAASTAQGNAHIRLEDRFGVPPVLQSDQYSWLRVETHIDLDLGGARSELLRVSVGKIVSEIAKLSMSRLMDHQVKSPDVGSDSRRSNAKPQDRQSVSDRAPDLARIREIRKRDRRRDDPLFGGPPDDGGGGGPGGGGHGFGGGPGGGGHGFGGGPGGGGHGFGGGPGGGGHGFGDGPGLFSSDMLSSLGGKFEPKGVKFDKAAEFFGSIGAIRGIRFDPDSKQLSLIGDCNPALPPVQLDDFRTAVQIAFGSGEESTDPMFSLDPADPANPAGEWLDAVYIPDALAGTHMGDVMFRADWVLKQYAFGVIADENGRIVGKRSSAVRGYKSYMELLKENPAALRQGSMCSRFWIVPLEMKIAMDEASKAVIFVRESMKIETRRMEVQEGRLADSPDQSNPVAEAFAAFFTAHYDDLARECPVLEEVREAAKVVAIVGWLKSNGLGINDFAEDCRQSLSRTDNHVKRVPSLSIEECVSTWGLGNAQIQLVGGVDLTPRLQRVPASTAVQQIAGNLSQLSGRAGEMAVGEIRSADRGLRFSALPLTPATKDTLQKQYLCTQDGVTYAADAEKRVRQVFDTSGNSASLDYDGDRLTGVHASSPDHWQIDGKIGSDNSPEVQLRSPNEDRFLYSYGADRLLREFRVNGEVRTRAKYGPDGGTVEIEHLRRVESSTVPIGSLTAKRPSTIQVMGREKLTRRETGPEAAEFHYARELPGGGTPRSEELKIRIEKDRLSVEGTSIGQVRFERKSPTLQVEEGPDGTVQYEFNEEDK